MGLPDDAVQLPRAIARGALPAGLATLAAMICVAALALAAAVTGVPFSTISRDPATALGGPFVTGYLSYLGACLWCASAAVSLFAWRVGGGDSPSRFLLHAGLLTAALGADDLFMLHDGLVPYVVADVEDALLAVYGLALCGLIVFHRRHVFQTNLYLLAAALTCFAAACVVDMELVRPGEARRHLLEDGFKFLGIANWSAWLIVAAAAAVRGTRRAPGNRVATIRDPLQQDTASIDAPRPWPARVGLTLGGIGLFVTVAGAVGQWLKHARGLEHSFGFIHQFGPDEEANLASWYASAVMLLCAALLGFLGWQAVSAWTRRRWWGLAALFVAMSADEVSQMHEMTIEPLRGLLGLRGALYFAWVVPGIVFAGIVAALSLRFLRRLPGRSRRLFLTAGATYLAGALGVEMISGWHAQSFGVDGLNYAMLSVSEEALELGGLVFFAYALCDHVSRTFSPRQFATAAPRVGGGEFLGS